MADSDPLTELPSEITDETDSFYDLLGVPSTASTEEIKGAYRTKVRQYHPDSCEEAYAEEMTFALNRAVDTLGSQAERMAYNELGHSQYHRQRSPAPDGSTQQSTGSGSYNSSIYELIQLAKISPYTTEPWWKLVVQSNGFKLLVVVVVSLTALFSLLLVL